MADYPYSDIYTDIYGGAAVGFVLNPPGLTQFHTFGQPTILGGTPTTVIQITAPTTADILDGLVPIRTDSFAFELIDRFGKILGDLEVGADTAPSLRVDTSRTTFRTCTGIEVFSADMSQIDVENDRLRISMLLQNGDVFPLGTLMFGQDNQAVAGWGIKQTPELFDEAFLIDQDLERTYSAVVGASVYDLITVLLAPFDFDVLIDAPDIFVASPLVYRVGTSRYAALKAVADLLGCFPPYFDNNRVFRFKRPKATTDTTSDHHYVSGTRILDENVQLQNSAYKAPNRYIVVGTDPTTSVVGVYDLPDSAPHSAASRSGRIVTTARTAQGIISTGAAQQAAYVDAITDQTPYGRVVMGATGDPRHDTFDTMEVLGVRYLETAWELQLVPGGIHRHEGVTLWPAG